MWCNKHLETRITNTETALTPTQPCTLYTGSFIFKLRKQLEATDAEGAPLCRKHSKHLTVSPPTGMEHTQHTRGAVLGAGTWGVEMRAPAQSQGARSAAVYSKKTTSIFWPPPSSQGGTAGAAAEGARCCQESPEGRSMGGSGGRHGHGAATGCCSPRKSGAQAGTSMTQSPRIPPGPPHGWETAQWALPCSVPTQDGQSWRPHGDHPA